MLCHLVIGSSSLLPHYRARPLIVALQHGTTVCFSKPSSGRLCAGAPWWDLSTCFGKWNSRSGSRQRSEFLHFRSCRPVQRGNPYLPLVGASHLSQAAAVSNISPSSSAPLAGSMSLQSSFSAAISLKKASQKRPVVELGSCRSGSLWESLIMPPAENSFTPPPAGGWG